MQWIILALRFCALTVVLILLALPQSAISESSSNAVASHPVIQQAIELRFDDPQAAVALLETELNAQPQRHTPEMALEMADLAARIARDHGWLDQAMRYSGQMIELAGQLEKPIPQGRALHMQGTILAEQGDISAAIKNFHNARQVLESTSDIGSLALAVNALGVAHNFLDDSERSLHYFQQALPLADEAGNSGLEISILSNLALIAADLEGPDQSIELHLQALSLAREPQRLPQIGNQLANLCKQYVRVDDLAAAEAACNEALPIAEALEHARLLGGTLMTFGDLRMAQNQPQSALDFYQRSLDQVGESLPFVEIELLEKMIEVHEQQGNLAQALSQMRRLKVLREEILDNERNQAIEELEVQYKVEQTARELEVLQLETELQAAEIQWRDSMLLASAIALILVLLIILITWRNYQTKSKLQRNLAMRNKELNHAIEQVSHLASRDALTGLMNRRAFKQAMEQENAQRLKSNTPLTLVMADIDKFKPINDAHGHPVGDQVLKIIAQRIKQHMRDTDVVCRWGGEEFILMLPDTSTEQARLIIQDLRNKLTQEPVETPVGDLPITLTFGIAEVISDIKTAIHAADEAMYRGKRTGPNRVVTSNLITLVSNSAG